MKWLVTGAAGFIGSNLIEELLSSGHDVLGIDNFSTGLQSNIERISDVALKLNQSNSFKFIQADISDLDSISPYFENVDVVAHLAALGSVPRSIKNPILSNCSNVTGFLNVIDLSKNAGINKFLFASSSSVYGDRTSHPKVEAKIGRPLSPYAGTKLINEIYAEIYNNVYEFSSIGLRFFNVFGPFQNPNGQYAAVIPKWFDAILNNKQIFIFGDGKTTRDFCYIKNAVQAIILASEKEADGFEVLNIAYGEENSLTDIAHYILQSFSKRGIEYKHEISYQDFRPGDVKKSLASIEKAEKFIGYKPLYSCKEGLDEFIDYIFRDPSILKSFKKS